MPRLHSLQYNTLHQFYLDPSLDMKAAPVFSERDNAFQKATWMTRGFSLGIDSITLAIGRSNSSDPTARPQLESALL